MALYGSWKSYRGIETIVEDEKVPTQRIALCLVFGFVLMLIVEQVITPTEHSHSMDISFKPIHKTSDALSQVEFDADIEDLEDPENSSPNRNNIANSTASNNPTAVAGSERAFTLFLGLVIHAAADGLALGVANLDINETGKPDPLSFIVFLALILHKGKSQYFLLQDHNSILSYSAHLSRVCDVPIVHEYLPIELPQIRRHLQRFYTVERHRFVHGLSVSEQR